jgi:Leucine-rich repeat (LRR) protein
LPSGFSKLTKLETLVLTNNQIATLPDELLQMPHLKLLSLIGNPLPEEEVARVRRALPKTDIRF